MFLTVVAKNRRPLFGRIENGLMIHSPAGITVDQCLSEIPMHFDVQLHARIVMPDHISALFTILSTPYSPFKRRDFGVLLPGTLPVIVRSFKSAATKQIHEICPELRHIQIWQRNYYERLIDQDAIAKVRRYIIDNPKNYR